MRPLLPNEEESGDSSVVSTELDAVMDPESNTLLETVAVFEAPGAREPKEFHVDKVFGPTTTQEEFYEEVEPVVQSAIDGFNTCVFAYGQVSMPQPPRRVHRPYARLWARGSLVEAREAPD